MAELLAELLGKLRIIKALVLRPQMLDLERTHQRGNAAGGGEVHALAAAVNQPGALGIAAAGGITHTDRVGRRNQPFALFGVDLRTAGAAGYAVCLDPLDRTRVVSGKSVAVRVDL